MSKTANYQVSPRQLYEPRRRSNFRGECRAPLGLLLILAPGLDLKAFIELCGGKGLARIETPFEQCQSDDQ
jgi:hypothetical protein